SCPSNPAQRGWKSKKSSPSARQAAMPRPTSIGTSSRRRSIGRASRVHCLPCRRLKRKRQPSSGTRRRRQRLQYRTPSILNCREQTRETSAAPLRVPADLRAGWLAVLDTPRDLSYAPAHIYSFTSHLDADGNTNCHDYSHTQPDRYAHI